MQLNAFLTLYSLCKILTNFSGRLNVYGKIESDVHTFQHSVDLCKIMDNLRKDWGLKYPFEK